MAIFNTASGQSWTLASSISSTQTSILLTSFKVPVSNTDITMATMNTSIAYGTIAPGTSSSELISFTGVTQNADGTATLTGVTRGLNKEYPYTESSSFKQPHAGQSIFILSDAPQVYNQYPAKVNDETITGRFTFPQSGTASSARAGAVYAAPTSDTEFATKKYVDNTASFGAPFATTTTPGLIALGTSTQIEAGTALGASSAWIGLTAQQYGARKIVGYALTTGSANAYAMTATTAISGYSTGQIIGFTASFTNTGNATINVNSLGAKNLFLGSTGLFAGAISTNAYIGAVYNGTQFDIIQGSRLFSAVASSNTVGLRDNNGDIFVPATPTSDNAAASKSYVDNKTGRAYSGSYTADGSSSTIFIGFQASQIIFSAVAGGSSGGLMPSYSFGIYSATSNNQFATYTTHNTSGGVNGSASTTTRVGVIQYGASPTPSAISVTSVSSTAFSVGTISGTTNGVFYWSATP